MAASISETGNRARRRMSAPLALMALGAAMLCAQRPGKLPVITGGTALYVMVEPDGRVKTWGSSSATVSFGNGPTASKPKLTAPTPLAGVSHVIGAAAGATHVLLLMADGTVAGWGQNGECEVGNGDAAHPLKRAERPKAVFTPVPVAGLRGVIQVAANDYISGAVLSDGTVRMWGTAAEGMLGNGTYRPRGMSGACAPTPQAVEGLDGVTQLSIGLSHVLALRRDSSVFAWGRNQDGEIGDGTREARPRPVQVPGIHNAVAVIATGGRSLALLADGTVRAWGSNSNGQLGDPVLSSDPPHARRLAPYAVPGLAGVKALQAGNGYAIAQLSDGTLRGWGEGYFGSLGNGSYDEVFPRPQPVKGLGPVVAIYSAARRVFALRADGTVFGWGPIDMATVEGLKPYSKVPVAVFRVE